MGLILGGSSSTYGDSGIRYSDIVDGLQLWCYEGLKYATQVGFGFPINTDHADSRGYDVKRHLWLVASVLRCNKI